MLILLVVGWAPMAVMPFFMLQSYEERAISARITEVQNQSRILSNQIISYNYLKDQTSDVIEVEMAQLSGLYDGRIIIIDDNFKVVGDTYDLIVGRYVVSEEVIRCFSGETTSQTSGRYVEMTIPIYDSNSSNIVGVLLVSFSTDSITDNLDALSARAWVFVLVVGALVLLVAVIASQLLVMPVRKVTAKLHDIASGHSTEELNVRTYSETAQISEEFNRVMTKMRVLDESRQEFVSNVSHELKTPITSIKILADSLLTQEEVPVELYREFMEDIAEEVDRENKIITDLLALVKMDKKAVHLNIEQVDVNNMLELILKRLRPIASKKNIEMVLESFRSVTAEVDEGRLNLAFTNLVENAIKYNKENGWVHVSLDADHQFFYVTVADSGIGISDEDIDYIFERFYRVDKSHSSEIDGTGLGLAIARSAVLLHKGSIKVSSEIGVGTTFSVRIPLTYIV